MTTFTSPSTTAPLELTFFHTAAPSLLADLNGLFELAEHGRPIHENDDSGHATVAVLDGVPVAAAYSMMPTYIARAAFLAGEGLHGAYLAPQLRLLRAVAVVGTHPQEDIAAHLVRSAAAHARADFGAEHLLARIPSDDRHNRMWLLARGFQSCPLTHTLRIDGVAMPAAPGTRDMWWKLVRRPRTTVDTVPTN